VHVLLTWSLSPPEGALSPCNFRETLRSSYRGVLQNMKNAYSCLHSQLLSSISLNAFDSTNVTDVLIPCIIGGQLGQCRHNYHSTESVTLTLQLSQPITQCFPILLDLRRPTEGKYNLRHPVGVETTAICFRVWWYFESTIFNNILKNALARLGTTAITSPSWSVFHSTDKNSSWARYFTTRTRLLL